MLSPGAVGNQASMIAIALVQPAEPPRTFTGKQLTVKPLDGSRSRAQRGAPPRSTMHLVFRRTSSHRVNERRVPAPPVGSSHSYATFQQVQRRLASHAAAPGDIIGAAVGGTSACVHNDNLERRKRVADALEFGFNIFGGCDIAVGEMSAIE